MKFKVVRSAAVIGAAVLVASCGGGGGSGVVGPGAGGSPAPDPSLQLSGTAATGIALANAAVEVKCAAGVATATTGANGTYTVTIARGALPCAVQVTGSGAASGVVLRSVAQSGSTDAATAVTSARANVTPVTELVVAQIVAAPPADFFANFGSASTGLLTADRIAAAKSAILGALKTAGVDAGSIDPLQGELVAATATTAGNAYDKVLDTLATKVSADALPLLVTQVASAASTGSSTQLADAMTAVQGGGLPGCPYVLSGNYRAIDYFGRMTLRPIDFAAKTIGAGDGVNNMSLVQDGTNPCAFTATLTQNGQTGEWQVAFGPGGVGIYRARISAPTASAGVTGIIFPVQSHAYAEVVGTWDGLVSGYSPTENIQHDRGKTTLAADRTATSCDYDTTWTCQPDTVTQKVVERSDGGFDVTGDTVVTTLYAYRTPGGVMALFGTGNPSGSTDPSVEQRSAVLTKLAPMALPAVGSGRKYSETLILFSWTGVRTTNPVTSDQSTVITVDAATNTVQRQRQSNAQVDTWHPNQPLAGLATRDAHDVTSAAYQFSVAGTGLSLTTNALGAQGRWLAYAVDRP